MSLFHSSPNCVTCQHTPLSTLNHSTSLHQSAPSSPHPSSKALHISTTRLRTHNQDTNTKLHARIQTLQDTTHELRARNQHIDTVREELLREMNVLAAQYDEVYDENSALKIQLAAARTYRHKEITDMHAISDKEGTKYQALKEY
jgi:phage shock protein A